MLVVDDQREVIDAARLLLQAHGISTVGARSPAEALHAVSRHPVDCALIDLNFEHGRTDGRQGLDLVADLARQQPSLPLIAMTAWGSDDLASQAARRGVRDFVEKPWENATLLQTVRAHAALGAALRKVTALEEQLQRARTNGASAAFTEMRLLEVEGLLVRQAMERFRGNISRAARALGLSRSALYRRLERHKIALN